MNSNSADGGGNRASRPLPMNAVLSLPVRPGETLAAAVRRIEREIERRAAERWWARTWAAFRAAHPDAGPLWGLPKREAPTPGRAAPGR